jgi:FdhD protein
MTEKRPSSELALPSASISTPVTTYDGSTVHHRRDLVTTEEPLEIRIVCEVDGRQQALRIAVTMRTPGEDYELATGFLVSEGVVSAPGDIWRIAHCEGSEASDELNIVEVYLSPTVKPDLDLLTRHVIISSSCGICGKASIEAVEAICPSPPGGDIEVDANVLVELPDVLASRQPVYSETGGLHAAALFDQQGKMLCRREDVGRHNALDKLVGSLFASADLPASDQIVLVSGRASFELVQKALLAGVPFLAAVGAPSSLAIELAETYGMTLVGFLRQRRFNIYCGAQRVAVGDG